MLNVKCYMKNYNQVKKNILRDKKIKEAYEKLGPEFNFIRTLIK